jgi:hypothetical protein
LETRQRFATRFFLGLFFQTLQKSIMRRALP